MPGSIKSKLIVYVILVSLVVFPLTGIVLYYELKSVVIGAIDSHAHSEVQLIAGLIEVEHGEFDVELSSIEVGEYAVPLSGHYYRVVSDTGDVVASSPSLSIVGATLPTPRLSLTPRYTTIAGPAKKPLRLLEQTFNVSDRLLTIQAAESLEDSQLLLSEFRTILYVLFFVLFMVFAVGILAVTSVSLRGLNVFASRIGSITEANLGERIDEAGADKELRPLAKSFNSMLSRIEEVFEKQKRFLSDASHELKTPTAVIKSTGEVTLSRERSGKEYAEALEKIIQTADKMALVVEDILKAARLEAETLALSLEEVDIGECVATATRCVEHAARERNVSIEVVAVDSLKVIGDREVLTESIINVLDNAIRYNKDGGRVVVTVKVSDAHCEVSVSDSGVGIPRGERKRVFERFYRGPSTRSMAAGSGLGLPIVKSIMEAHGGSVSIEDSPLGGTTIRLRIPLSGQQH